MELPAKPVGWDISGPDIGPEPNPPEGMPVGWDITGPGNPVGCTMRGPPKLPPCPGLKPCDGGCCCPGGTNCSGVWNCDGVLCGRVGTKLLNPVVVGTSGERRDWFCGTGAYGPRGPICGCCGWYKPVCCACRCCPIGSGELLIPMPVWKLAGGGDRAVRVSEGAGGADRGGCMAGLWVRSWLSRASWLNTSDSVV